MLRQPVDWIAGVDDIDMGWNTARPESNEQKRINIKPWSPISPKIPSIYLQ